MSLPTDYPSFVSEVAELLEMTPSELGADDSLLDFGLDSIRLMSLVERLRGSGVPVSFEQLAESPTLRSFAAHLGLAP
jgi:bifunctional isochorismate lyase / aryl carrier protein